MKLRISAWAIRNPTPIALLFVALTIAGLMSFATLPIKQFPNVALPIVVVSVTESGAAPTEIENQITRPVEDAIAGVSNIKHISSTDTLGASTTVIEFELGTNMQKATDDVRTAVDRTRAVLPPGIDPPYVQRIDADTSPLVTFAVGSSRMSPTDLSWFVDDSVSRAVQATPGVSQVQRLGGIDREINVTLDPSKMSAFGVTAPMINQALYAFNVDSAGGRADIGAREQTVRVLGQAGTIDALRSLTIPTAAGRYVALDDVAEIGDGAAEQRGFARLNGRPVVAFQVTKTADASEVRTENGVKKAIAALVKAHPEAQFTEVVSTVKDTRKSFKSTEDVLIEGMVLAALVVFVFLRSWRATAIAALAMPLSLIPTFSAIQLFGFSLDTISLLSLTLVIGILVDDAIVEIENIEKRIERGETPYRAALIGADSIGLAVVATTAAIVAVFTPVSFMSGIIGEYFREFGLTVAVSVLFSLVVARLLTPLLAAYFLKAKPHPKPKKPLNEPYRRTLDWAFRHKGVSAGIGFAILVGSLFMLAHRPTGFMPNSDSGVLYLNMEGPPGATREQMSAAADQVDRMLARQPAVERVFTQVGPGSDSGDEVRNGTVTVTLKDVRSLTTDQFKERIRPLLRMVPDVRIATAGGFGGADVEIVLSGQNGDALTRAQYELMREMRGLTMISGVRPTPPPAGPEIVVRPKPDEAARLGVTSSSLASVLRIATIGDIDANVAKFSEGERRIPIRVRLPQASRTDLQVLGQLQVPTANGGTTPLSSVADLSFQAGPAKIKRYGRERRVSVQADRKPGTSLGTALAAVNTLPIMKHLPAGVHQPPFGDAEQLGELVSGFMIAIASGVALIFGVLVLLFKSFFKPAIILMTLPLTLAGTAVALTVTGMEIDMPVFIGLLMLFGIAAKNSILLVEFAIEDERSGQTRVEALMNACRERARPIIMTTVAMVAGMLPTALALGAGSEFRRPMAIAVIGGLISSTALSLILVPVIYLFVDAIEARLRPLAGRLITRKRPGDDAPIREGEETLVTTGAMTHAAE